MSTAKTIYQITGPKGDTGAAGTNGTDGVDAFTTTTASFTMPAEDATVVVAVSDSSWASVGQVVHVTGAGHFEVSAKPSTTQLTLENLEDTTNSLYTENVAPGTVVASGKRVSPAGLQGPSGTAGTGGADADAWYVVTKATDAPTNALNLGGLGSGLVYSTSAAGVSTISIKAIGTDVQAYDAELAALAGLASAADKLPYFDGAESAALADFTDAGRALLDDATADIQRATLSAAKLGANTDITSLGGLTTALSQAQGGTGVTELPYFSVNLGGSDQAAVVTATPTKIGFDNEVSDSNSDFDTTTNRFTPEIAGAYAFTVAAQVNDLAATGDIVQVHLRKNGTTIATAKAVAPDASDNVQAVLHFVTTANGSTDYFEAFVEHDAGVNKDVEGDEEVTFFCGHWCG